MILLLNLGGAVVFCFLEGVWEEVFRKQLARVAPSFIISWTSLLASSELPD